MAMTMRPILFLSDGSSSELGAVGREIIQYEVVGLPPKTNALIGKKDGHWRILKVRDNLAEGWRGQFETAEAALQALADETTPSSRPGKARRDLDAP